jgi:hypothetical protein
LESDSEERSVCEELYEEEKFSLDKQLMMEDLVSLRLNT